MGPGFPFGGGGVRPSSWGDGESFLGGGRCLWSACGGRSLPLARAQQLGGRGVLPRWRPVPMEGLRGTAGPKTARAHQPGGRAVPPRRRSVPLEGLLGTTFLNGPGPPAGGTGSPAQAAVGADGGPAGDSSSQTARTHQLGGRWVLPRWRSAPMEGLRGTAGPKRHGPTSWGDGGSCPGGGRCLWRAFGGQRVPKRLGPTN